MLFASLQRYIVGSTLGEEMGMQTSSLLSRITQRPVRAKLIFNANSGRVDESPHQLATILSEMQDHHILPEVFTVRPDSRLEDVVHKAIKSGIGLIVVAGGDGTIDSVVGAMVGSDATLGIIPTGTRNNVALNLGIPKGIAEAVALLRHGHRRRIDVGHIQRGRVGRWFLELAAVGLLSDLYPVADNIQHGNLAQIGELLSTFFAAAPARLTLTLDNRKQIKTTAHMMLVANMGFLGPNFQISPKVSFKDGRLDVFLFSDMSKLNLASYMMQAIAGPVERAEIKHYRVRHLTIHSTPKAPVMADGGLLGQGRATILVHPHALRVIAGSSHNGGNPVAPNGNQETVPNGQ
jgi:diacylglycerol kinase (ATP)